MWQDNPCEPVTKNNSLHCRFHWELNGPLLVWSCLFCSRQLLWYDVVVWERGLASGVAGIAFSQLKEGKLRLSRVVRASSLVFGWGWMPNGVWGIHTFRATMRWYCPDGKEDIPRIRWVIGSDVGPGTRGPPPKLDVNFVVVHIRRHRKWNR